MMTSQDGEKQQAAWKFIKFALGPKGQTISVMETGYVPMNTKAIEDPDLLGRFCELNPAQKTAFSQMSVTGGWYAFPGPNSEKITDTIKDHLQSVVTLKRTPAEAMESMVRNVSVLLPN